MMKRFSCLILLAFILGVISVTALSHPGRTDSNGGHYDRSTGEYHYHSGEYAGRTQSSSDNNSAKLPPVKSNETTGNTSSQNNIEPTNKKWYEASWVEMVIVLIVIALYSFPLVIFILLILYPFTLCIKKLNIEHRVNTYEEKVEKYLSCQEKHEEKEYEYEHFKFSRIPIPYDCEIGADGLPKEKNSNGWGEKFTVYQSKNGNTIHVVCGCSFAYKPRHVYFYRNSNIKLCKKCGNAEHYNLPNMDWYDDYLKYTKLRSEISELTDRLKKLKKEVIICGKNCKTLPMRIILLFSPKNKVHLKMIEEKLYKKA